MRVPDEISQLVITIMRSELNRIRLMECDALIISRIHRVFAYSGFS